MLEAQPRGCYVCGRAAATLSQNSFTIERICETRACAERFAALEPRHCQARDRSGVLCGQPGGPLVGRGDRPLCSTHLRRELDAL
jgi:hypothetical protein